MAIRTLGNIKKRDSINSFFYKHKIIKLPDVHKYNVLLFVYKYLNGKVTSTLKNMFTIQEEKRPYDNRNRKFVKKPIYKYNLGRRSIKVTGVDFWEKGNYEHKCPVGELKHRIREEIVEKYHNIDN